MAEFLFAMMIALILGYTAGWSHAHKTVATECERLGSFYVGDKAFHCNSIEERAK